MTEFLVCDTAIQPIADAGAGREGAAASLAKMLLCESSIPSGLGKR